MRRGSPSFVCVFGILVLLVFSPFGTAPAHASAGALGGASALSAPLTRYGRAATIAPAAIPPGSKYMDLPMGTGGRVSGYIPNGAYHVYHVPLYAGQNLTAHFPGMPNGWELHLYNRNIQYDALRSVYDGGPLLWINYTAGQVDHDGELWDFDFGYDLVVFPPPGGGWYNFEWDALDPGFSPSTRRIAGENRYQTANMASGVFPTADTVVVATGLNYVDALAASALCGSYDAPLVLTGPKSLSPEAKYVVDGRQATQVFVIGSSKTLPDVVLNALKKPGRTVERIQGANRFETAAAIAEKVREHEIAEGRTPSKEALVVNGFDYPDALSASPYAFSRRMPILLATPTYLPAVTRDAFATLGVDTVHVIGGYASVSQAAVDAIPVPLKDRLAGKDRCDTSSQVASYAVNAGWAGWDRVALATGYNFPDGLVAGVYSGKRHGVVLLSKPLYMQRITYESLFEHRSEITSGSAQGRTGLAFFGSRWTLSGFVHGEGEDAIAGEPW